MRELSMDAVLLMAHSMLVRQLCGELIEAGALTQVQAARAFTEASRELREGTERDTEADSEITAGRGEIVAKTYEQQAHWLLSYSGIIMSTGND